jgi:hypothetical protein
MVFGSTLVRTLQVERNAIHNRCSTSEVLELTSISRLCDSGYNRGWFTFVAPFPLPRLYSLRCKAQLVKHTLRKFVNVTISDIPQVCNQRWANRSDGKLSLKVRMSCARTYHPASM